MSKFGSGIFFDGLTNARHPVAVALGADVVEISLPGGGILAAWRFSEISPLATPKGVLHFGRTNSKDAARLEIRDEALATELIGRAKRLPRAPANRPIPATHPRPKAARLSLIAKVPL